MIIENPDLCAAMQEFFGRLSDFQLAADEEIAVSGMSYPDNLDPRGGTSFARRCASVRQASEVALRELGPSSELFVAIVVNGSGIPRPSDTRVLLGFWEMRAKREDENGLLQPTWCLQSSPVHELQLTYRYPSGGQHICQATVWIDRQRYRGPVAVDLFEVLRDRSTSFSAS